MSTGSAKAEARLDNWFTSFDGGRLGLTTWKWRHPVRSQCSLPIRT